MTRFLVVDDDDRTVEAMTKLLRDDGHEVCAYTSGADAIATLQTEKFDAVISDLEMPLVDGRKVAKAVRDHSPDACVVLTTIHHPKDHVEHACLMVQKPIDYETLTGAISHCRAHGGYGSKECCATPPSLGRHR